MGVAQNLGMHLGDTKDRVLNIFNLIKAEDKDYFNIGKSIGELINFVILYDFKYTN